MSLSNVRSFTPRSYDARTVAIGASAFSLLKEAYSKILGRRRIRTT